MTRHVRPGRVVQLRPPSWGILRADFSLLVTELPDGLRLRVLVADDHPVNRRQVTGLLTPRGHDVIAAESGQQAVAAAQDGRFDLIVMDVEMPGMAGFQAAVEIRHTEEGTGRRVPIVAITSRDQAGDVEDDRSPGSARLMRYMALRK